MTTYSKQSIPQYPRPDRWSIELDIIVEAGTGGRYSWDDFTVLRHPETGALYSIEGSGCSCNGLFDDVNSLNDLAGPYPNMQAVVAAAQRWENEAEDWAGREGAAASVAEALLRAERDAQVTP